jgi:hypothetical protein
MLSGMHSYEAIVQFGKERGGDFLYSLGFTTRWGLCKATYSRVFRRIDIAAFEAVVTEWLLSRIDPEKLRQLAIDGKTLRGSRDGELPAVHLVALYAVEAGAVLGQLCVDAKTNELKAGLELLGVVPLEGCLVTGDAMFANREVCDKIIKGGGDYLLTVKDNQPTLHADIKAAFAEPGEGLSPPAGCAPRREHGRGDSGRQGTRPPRAANRSNDHLAERLLVQ